MPTLRLLGDKEKQSLRQLTWGREPVIGKTLKSMAESVGMDEGHLSRVLAGKGRECQTCGDDFRQKIEQFVRERAKTLAKDEKTDVILADELAELFGRRCREKDLDLGEAVEMANTSIQKKLACISVASLATSDEGSIIQAAPGANPEVADEDLSRVSQQHDEATAHLAADAEPEQEIAQDHGAESSRNDDHVPLSLPHCTSHDDSPDQGASNGCAPDPSERTHVGRLTSSGFVGSRAYKLVVVALGLLFIAAIHVVMYGRAQESNRSELIRNGFAIVLLPETSAGNRSLNGLIVERVHALKVGLKIQNITLLRSIDEQYMNDRFQRDIVESKPRFMLWMQPSVPGSGDRLQYYVYACSSSPEYEYFSGGVFNNQQGPEAERDHQLSVSYTVVGMAVAALAELQSKEALEQGISLLTLLRRSDQGYHSVAWVSCSLAELLAKRGNFKEALELVRDDHSDTEIVFENEPSDRSRLIAANAYYELGDGPSALQAMLSGKTSLPPSFVDTSTRSSVRWGDDMVLLPLRYSEGNVLLLKKGADFLTIVGPDDLRLRQFVEGSLAAAERDQLAARLRQVRERAFRGMCRATILDWSAKALDSADIQCR